MDRPDLPEKTKTMLDDFVKGLRDIYGEGLVSVMLYGSAASGEYAQRHSNVNVAIVLDDGSLSNAARSSRLVNRYRFKPVKPVFLTDRHIAGSAHVFPVEFLDMKENHLVLFGRDVTKDLAIDLKNLAFQCEQELRSKLINIKTAFLEVASSADRKKLLFRFFTSCLHVLRNMLRLKTGAIPPYSKEDVIREIAKEFNADVSSFTRIVEAKKGISDLRAGEIEPLFFNFAAEVEKIADAMDKT